MRILQNYGKIFCELFKEKRCERWPALKILEGHGSPKVCQSINARVPNIFVKIMSYLFKFTQIYFYSFAFESRVDKLFLFIFFFLRK